MEQILNGIEGISIFLDGICIWEEKHVVHMDCLKQVLGRFRE